MQVNDFVRDATLVEAITSDTTSMLAIAGLTVSEWHCLKAYVFYGEILDEEVFNAAKEKVTNFEKKSN